MSIREQFAYYLRLRRNRGLRPAQARYLVRSMRRAEQIKLALMNAGGQI